jgi:tRNA threonylcarbamoyladenosine biosynthesis protein TsaE
VIRARTAGVEETRALGGAVAGLVRPGDVILLVGDLGAGKTAFAQGFAIGIGVEEQVTSPTFTLVRSYRGGRLVLHHLDVYRLDRLHEAEDLGLAELIDDGGVVLIEWGDAVTGVLPASFLEVQFTFLEGDDDRALAMRTVGPHWSIREGPLTAATQGWAVDA